MDIGVGKQQLVEIAKALSKEVRLLILDEPTAALNDEDSAHLLDLLRGLRDEGITCVIISHKLNEIAAIADSDHDPARRPDDRDARHDAPTSVTEDRIIAGMVGRDLDHRFPPHEPHDRRGGAADRGLDRAQPDPARPGRRVQAPT